MNQATLNSSFRDPSGFVFLKENILYRQVNKIYANEFDEFINGGLYKRLLERNLIIPHEETSVENAYSQETAYKIIKPKQVPFISYPYEWSFSMFKDAALTTLEIQKEALNYGMSLKDASAYNIQFIDAKPVFIDTLSFEKYEEGKPWVAYQQFCKHFLAPLALMAYTNVELGKLMQVYIDGIPLDLANKLLPVNAKINPGLLMHIILHSKSQNTYSESAAKDPKLLNTTRVSKNGLMGIVDSLHSTVHGLSWNLPKTEWGSYYSITNYTDMAMEEKCNQVEELILQTKPKTVWDLGANNGRFSRLASKHGINTVAFDIDPVAVEINYLGCKASGEKNMLPLIQDLTNPSTGIGFANEERDSLLKRGPADTVLALALIHHLAISNNLPFDKIAKFFAECGSNLIIEFVPKSDSQVKKLLSSRKDIFPNYNIETFTSAFNQFFYTTKRTDIPGTDRALFLLETRDNT